MEKQPTKEIIFHAKSGWAMFAFQLVFLAGIIFLFIAVSETRHEEMFIFPILCIPVWIVMNVGFFIVNPNHARVLVLFGNYRGTVLKNGFFWTNPFTVKKNISLRARNLNTDTLKVNDKGGNPIEIATIVVWKVNDTAHACFDVDDYTEYVNLQCDSALRQLASRHIYDEADDEVISLRAGREEVSAELQAELSERAKMAGVEIIEAKLSHLAYAPEIAGAMLRRQQAHAIIAARQKIVDGAVGMVEMALDKLKEQRVVDLDEEKKASMVSNLMVVLCSETGTQPVVNTGTLYN